MIKKITTYAFLLLTFKMIFTQVLHIFVVVDLEFVLSIFT